MSQPAVSLVMTAFTPNQAWLNTAVRSALEQSGCTTELLLVDDGSKTPAESLLARDLRPRVRIIRRPHGGVSRARQVGLVASAGSHVRFLDADDFFPHDSTARLLALTEKGTRISCGATRWCAEDLTPSFDWLAGCGRQPVRRTLLMRSCPMTPAVLFPREILDLIGPWDPKLHVSEDWDYILRAFERAPVVETKHVVAYYRRHLSSASCDRDEGLRGSERVVDRYFERHPEQRNTRLERQARAALDLLEVELSEAPLMRDRRFWRALRRDPTALEMVRRRIVHPRIQARRLGRHRPATGRPNQ